VERVWNESRPNRRLWCCSIPFTAIYGTVASNEHQIVWILPFHRTVLALKKLTGRTFTIPPRVKRRKSVDNGDTKSKSRLRCKSSDASPLSALSRVRPPPRRVLRLGRYKHSIRLVHCVLAAECDGCATDTNEVACKRPVPSGVGIEKRNGTSTRVPAIGASQTSASRNSTRYLIAGRSGT
jgi:hypothetical protein